MSDLLTKKKRVVVEQVPVFDHSNKDIQEAVGVPGLVNEISKKIEMLVTDQTVISPSIAVEYFYNNFSLIELSFMAMHTLGRGQEAAPNDGIPFEEVV